MCQWSPGPGASAGAQARYDHESHWQPTAARAVRRAAAAGPGGNGIRCRRVRGTGRARRLGRPAAPSHWQAQWPHPGPGQRHRGRAPGPGRVRKSNRKTGASSYHDSSALSEPAGAHSGMPRPAASGRSRGQPADDASATDSDLKPMLSSSARIAAVASPARDHGRPPG